MIPHRRKCCFARDEGFCDYWQQAVKCLGCKFAGDEAKSQKERDDLYEYSVRHHKKRP